MRFVIFLIKNANLSFKKKLLPKVIKEIESKELNFEANYKDKEDLKELLNLSNKNLKIQI